MFLHCVLRGLLWSPCSIFLAQIRSLQTKMCYTYVPRDGQLCLQIQLSNLQHSHLTWNNSNMCKNPYWEHLDSAEHRCHCQHRLIMADKKKKATGSRCYWQQHSGPLVSQILPIFRKHTHFIQQDKNSLWCVCLLAGREKRVSSSAPVAHHLNKIYFYD